MRYGIINDIRILNPKDFPLMIQRYAALAFDKHKIKNSHDLPKPLPWPHIHCTSQEIQMTLNKFNIHTTTQKQKTIGVCPGAESGPAKCWPAYHYANLTQQLIYQGYHIILLGSYKEKKIGHIINNQLPKNFQIHCTNLIGLTSLDEAILIIKTCNAIVSNDSGLMHIACALHRPVVVLYGPTTPNFTPPLYNHVKIITLNKYYNNQKIKQPHHLNGYHPRLIKIQPEQVLKALKMLLK